MYPSKKTVFLLLSGLIFAIFISCAGDNTRRQESTADRRDFRNRRDFGNRQTFGNQPWQHTSNLPLVIIDTYDRWIPSEPKIPARMKIIYDKSGGRNNLESPHVHFDGKIGIEVRGQTSQMFPKKQYGFEFRDDAGNDKDVSIFQLPAESDWVLNGPYSDKTLMRNYLAYEFSNRIGRYASRTKFVEVFLNTNGDRTIQARHYVGVYLLIEKIKRGKDRVDIQSLQSTHSKPPEITGGYIIKIDKMDRNETFFYTQQGTRFAHVYPKGHKMSRVQKMWIRDYMSMFESALAGPHFKDPERGYAKYIDVESFIDHFIINELFKNTDGFRFSAYMFKDRGEKLKAGPVWDFNLATGNTVIHNGWETDSWLIYTNPVPFWWHRLLSDENFKRKLVKRWKTLRKNELATSEILGEIDRTAEYLSEAQKRNFQKWRVLGRTIFGNRGPAKPTYQGEVQAMKTWLQTRLQWMDKNIELLPQTRRYTRRYR